MANPLPPVNLGQQIPAPYPQAERAWPGGGDFGFQRNKVTPDSKGNLGFDQLPSDGFASNADPNYKPIKIVKR